MARTELAPPPVSPEDNPDEQEVKGSNRRLSWLEAFQRLQEERQEKREEREKQDEQSITEKLKKSPLAEGPKTETDLFGTRIIGEEVPADRTVKSPESEEAVVNSARVAEEDPRDNDEDLPVTDTVNREASVHIEADEEVAERGSENEHEEEAEPDAKEDLRPGPREALKKPDDDTGEVTEAGNEVKIQPAELEPRPIPEPEIRPEPKVEPEPKRGPEAEEEPEPEIESESETKPALEPEAGPKKDSNKEAVAEIPHNFTEKVVLISRAPEAVPNEDEEEAGEITDVIVESETPVKADAEEEAEQPERVATERPENAIEADQPDDEQPKTSEHIGHMLMTATEAETRIKSEKRERSADKEEEESSKQAKTGVEKLAEKLNNESAVLPTGKRVETLSRSELLNISERIIINGNSLRQIYETHLIGERGLRRLITEHLLGGDLKKALRREIVEREIDFERDPVLRDMDPQNVNVSTGGGSPALNELLQRAIPSADSDEEVAFFKARAAYETLEQQKYKKRRHIIDISLSVTIAFLILMLVFLYITRR